MQIRCQHCHRPFGVGREFVVEVLDEMKAQDLGYHTFVCPHCGKNNRSSKAELMRAAPDWGKAEKPKEA
ncbi:MAG TPA: hypothetical protein PKM21_02140 [Anaerolineales bacterium]|nr:hypothetical protein [Anaerolineales bacterium]